MKDLSCIFNRLQRLLAGRSMRLGATNCKTCCVLEDTLFARFIGCLRPLCLSQRLTRGLNSECNKKRGHVNGALNPTTQATTTQATTISTTRVSLSRALKLLLHCVSCFVVISFVS